VAARSTSENAGLVRMNECLITRRQAAGAAAGRGERTGGCKNGAGSRSTVPGWAAFMRTLFASAFDASKSEAA
jgi:hypothetical protein